MHGVGESGMKGLGRSGTTDLAGRPRGAGVRVTAGRRGRRRTSGACGLFGLRWLAVSLDHRGDHQGLLALPLCIPNSGAGPRYALPDACSCSAQQASSRPTPRTACCRPPYDTWSHRVQAGPAKSCVKGLGHALLLPASAMPAHSLPTVRRLVRTSGSPPPPPPSHGPRRLGRSVIRDPGVAADRSKVDGGLAPPSPEDVC